MMFGKMQQPFNKLIACIILLVCMPGSKLFAQPEATMYTLTGVPQHTNYNPAFIPTYKVVVSIGVASLHAHFSNSSFSYNDLVTKQGDSLVADVAKLYRSMYKKNYITTAADAEFFRLGLKLHNRFYANWTISTKAYARQMIPKDLTALFSKGTAAFVNGTASISPQLETTSYLESAWGGTYLVNDKFTVGARVKMLWGIVNANTKEATLNLSLDNDYAITAAAELNARTSGIENFDDVDFARDYKKFLKNRGAAIDLGATYEITPKLMVGASLLDIGAITWRNDTYGYRMDPSKAQYTFKGVDLQKILDGDEDYLAAEKDSIEKSFDIQESAIGKYRTPLPAKMYLTASYTWKRHITFGGLIFIEKFRGRFHPGLSLSAHKEFWRIAGASISYTAVNRGFGNFGAGFNLNLTPFQFYLVGDNLLRMPLSYIGNGNYEKFANNARYVNVRLGMNFVFGRHRLPQGHPYIKRNK